MLAHPSLLDIHRSDALGHPSPSDASDSETIRSGDDARGPSQGSHAERRAMPYSSSWFLCAQKFLLEKFVATPLTERWPGSDSF